MSILSKHQLCDSSFCVRIRTVTSLCILIVFENALLPISVSTENVNCFLELNSRIEMNKIQKCGQNKEKKNKIHTESTKIYFTTNFIQLIKSLHICIFAFCIFLFQMRGRLRIIQIANGVSLNTTFL